MGAGLCGPDLSLQDGGSTLGGQEEQHPAHRLKLRQLHSGQQEATTLEAEGGAWRRPWLPLGPQRPCPQAHPWHWLPAGNVSSAPSKGAGPGHSFHRARGSASPGPRQACERISAGDWVMARLAAGAPQRDWAPLLLEHRP